MSIFAKLQGKDFSNFPKEDVNKIEKLILTIKNLKQLETDQQFQEFINQVSPNIKYLRLKCLESLVSLLQKGQFNLTNFKNLKCLSLSSEYNDQMLRSDQKLFDKIFEQIYSLQNLEKLYIDLESTQLVKEFISQIAQSISKLKKIGTLRLELGHNQIQDKGCEQITQAISKLTQLRELTIGLENNNIGNVGFRQVFQMISKLENLEKLQIDLWGNEQDDNADEDIYEILKNSKVCQSLKEFRILSDTTRPFVKNPIKLIESFNLFTNLIKVSLSIDTNSFTENISDSLNNILTLNSKTLQTVSIDFLKSHDNPNIETSNGLNNIFNNMGQMKNLENLFIQFHDHQSYSSAFEFLQQINQCPKLVKLSISSQFKELINCQLSQTVNFFKRLLEIPYLIEFDYAKYNQELDFQWYDQFFQVDWSYKYFIDDNLVNLINQNLQESDQKKQLQQKIQELQEQYIGDGDYSYSERSQEDSDYQSHEEEEGQDEEDEYEDVDNDDEDEDEVDQEGQEEQNQNLIDQSYESEEFSDQEDSQDEQNIKLSFEEQERKLEKTFSNLTYLKKSRHYQYKQRELLRFIAYNKILSSILETQFSNSPHIKRNLWDLHLI